MFYARRDILKDQPTALTQALTFLVRDYEPQYFYWELIEAWKKLVLVGFAVLISPGSIIQIVAAFVFSLVHMLLVAVAMPFREDSDDYFGKACGFSLTAVFFFSVILKVGVLSEAVDEVLTTHLRERFVFNAALISIGMIASIVAALLLAAAMATNDLIKASRKPLIRLVDTKSMPELPMEQGQRWHLFLSQCAACTTAGTIACQC